MYSFYNVTMVIYKNNYIRRTTPIYSPIFEPELFRSNINTDIINTNLLFWVYYWAKKFKNNIDQTALFCYRLTNECIFSQKSIFI